MSKAMCLSLEEIAEYFGELEDPRSSINLLHPLISVVMIGLMATLAGAAGPTAIAVWAGMKEVLLLKCLDLPNGIPRKDVFRRVLAALKPDVFQACFLQWIALRREAGDMDKPVVAIDAKTLRRSHNQSKGLGALHVVSAWATDMGLSLGQADQLGRDDHHD